MYAQTKVSIQTNDIIHFNRAGKARGWQYLLADSLSFRKEHASNTNAIRIQKPANEQLPSWIKRLITSGQCETIYVENLSLPKDEKIAIKRLCTQFSVSLVGLTINDSDTHNVVKGPW